MEEGKGERAYAVGFHEYAKGKKVGVGEDR